MQITCCKDCVPPKRHEACHDHCPEYNTEMILNIVKEAEKRRWEEVNANIYLQRRDSVTKAKRRKRRTR